MKIKNNLLNQVFQEAAIRQTAENYKNSGYMVEITKKIGGIFADLVATKENEMIIFEFKSGRWDPQKAKQVAKLKSYVNKHNLGEFKLVIVNPPVEKEIYIEGIEDIIFQELLKDTSRTDHLATHVNLDEVSDIEIDSINIDKNSMDISGNGFATYEIQYGSDFDVLNDDGLRSTEIFPLSFRIYLNHDLEIDEVAEIDIDTSSYYE